MIQLISASSRNIFLLGFHVFVFSDTAGFSLTPLVVPFRQSQGLMFIYWDPQKKNPRLKFTSHPYHNFKRLINNFNHQNPTGNLIVLTTIATCISGLEVPTCTSHEKLFFLHKYNVSALESIFSNHPISQRYPNLAAQKRIS
jgi:hypothetical protein